MVNADDQQIITGIEILATVSCEERLKVLVALAEAFPWMTIVEATGPGGRERLETLLHDEAQGTVLVAFQYPLRRDPPAQPPSRQHVTASPGIEP